MLDAWLSSHVIVYGPMLAFLVLGAIIDAIKHPTKTNKTRKGK